MGGSGTNADIRAAVDTAVADGVDVLSLSLGGSVPQYFSDIPYMNAAKAAGVCGASSGQCRPALPMRIIGTLSNAAPWYLTVGATTIGRDYYATLSLGNGVDVRGVSFGATHRRLTSPCCRRLLLSSQGRLLPMRPYVTSLPLIEPRLRAESSCARTSHPPQSLPASQSTPSPPTKQQPHPP
ncbi:hypothetical protein CLOP_g18528 [Closterium sp. NIES-67]|nr:hypothetical protein CLOP_g18528 [Closterium sp. NIES-67]